MGEKLQAVTSCVWVTKGRRVSIIQPPVPVPQSVIASPRAAATAIVCRTPREHQASTTQVVVPQMLFLHSIGRFVFRIFPLTAFTPWIKEYTKNSVAVAQQLSFLVPEAMAKASKTRALQKALGKLSERRKKPWPTGAGRSACPEFQQEF
ncbi:hypothetical protein DPEC_G00096600 [Dallia pectoralis]|uniref:Uncharacterized protein n=1 Tax=Dallia pectoralis TaxID=75939 RepID=A0ACC2GWI3_DALPE|nr:hypothetical protein DPEC_G00096600 [Dallia pectoralis]